MKIIVAVLSFCMGISCLAGENLIKNGDFSEATGMGLYPECGLNSGKLELVQEVGTDNLCGMLSIDQIRQDGRFKVASASAWIGGHKGRGGGFEVLPDTVYEFSLKIRGTAPEVRIGSMNWVGDELWKDMKSVKSSLELVQVTDSWQEIRGTFRTGPQARRAALRIQMWSSTKYGYLKYNLWDYVLFDDVQVREKVY